MNSKKRTIMFYSQHISGVGHHFRNREIIRALSQDHKIHFVDGGRKIPGAYLPPPVNHIHLTPIFRHPSTGHLVGEDATREVGEVLRDRARVLKDVIRHIRPDVFVIEFYPFAREDFALELTRAIQEVRACNSRANVLCSLRDIPRRSQSVGFTEDPPPSPSTSRYRFKRLLYLNSPKSLVQRDRRLRTIAYYESVVLNLNQYFDYLLVHGDPQVTRLEEHFQWTNEIRIPIVYTGYVSEKPDPHRKETGDRYEKPFVLVSAGGGLEGYELISPCIKAWKLLYKKGSVGDRQMVIFTGLFVEKANFVSLEKSCADGAFLLNGFTPDFVQWMQKADLSISRSGYNTCMNILETRTWPIFAPSLKMGDQAFRAHRLADMGLGEVIDPAEANSEWLAQAILRGLSQPPMTHHIALDGAEKTREFISRLP